MSFAKVRVCILKMCFVSGDYVRESIADFRRKYYNLFPLVLSITILEFRWATEHVCFKSEKQRILPPC